MDDSPFTHLIATGACYVDTILTVPAYPPEDAKQRASTMSKRRGGNCPNSIEVLQQLYGTRIERDEASETARVEAVPELVVLSILPDRECPDHEFITASLNGDADVDSIQAPHAAAAAAGDDKEGIRSRSRVNFDHTFDRQGVLTAASSYIIQSQATHSRTIVNYNGLDEMTLPEFQDAVTSLLASSEQTTATQTQKRLWFHFEGRIPEVILQCIQWLRSSFQSPPSSSPPPPPTTSSSTSSTSTSKPLPATTTSTSTSSIKITVSVECEKPQRPGLQALAAIADVVFYSRSWAEGQGFTSATECLASEARRIASAQQPSTLDDPEAKRKVTLCCTWGARGASALEFCPDSGVIDRDAGEGGQGGAGDGDVVGGKIVTCPAWKPEDEELRIVDTIGAGDTWIAGMLFCLVSRSAWGLAQKVDFASELAGRKIVRDGFGGLGRDMRTKMMDGMSA